MRDLSVPDSPRGAAAIGVAGEAGGLECGPGADLGTAAHPGGVSSSIGISRTIEDWLAGRCSPLLFFAVAQLGGMVIRRGITAVVVALVLGLALAATPVRAGGRPDAAAAGLFVLPAVLLAVTWAWSGDWLLDRPAPGRWLRLGLLITSSSIASGLVHGLSCMEHPRRRPDPPPAAWIEAAATRCPLMQNAAELLSRCGTPADRSNGFTRIPQSEPGGTRRGPPRGCATRSAGSRIPISRRWSISPSCRRWFNSSS